jgi:hypothetical protein
MRGSSRQAGRQRQRPLQAACMPIDRFGGLYVRFEASTERWGSPMTSQVAHALATAVAPRGCSHLHWSRPDRDPPLGQRPSGSATGSAPLGPRRPSGLYCTPAPVPGSSSAAIDHRCTEPWPPAQPQAPLGRVRAACRISAGSVRSRGVFARACMQAAGWCHWWHVSVGGRALALAGTRRWLLDDMMEVVLR